MIKIAISQAAFDAIAETLPLGTVAVEPYFTAEGLRTIWIDPREADKLAAMRGEGETYSDVILRLVGAEAKGLS
jgi:hypothetical protein